MKSFIRQRRTPLLFAAVAVIASIFASGAVAQDTGTDTAYVPFVVNVDAAVKAEFDAADADAAVPPVTLSAKAGAEAVMRIPLRKTVGVLFSGTQRAANVPSVSARGGKVAVSLPAQSYGSAEVALYTVSGKRILRLKVSASNAVNRVSRPSLAPGAYLLSVKGSDKNAVASRLTHSGGSLDINTSFGDGNRSSSAERLTKKAAAGDWTITVSAEGRFDSLYTLNPAAGTNPVQTITLRVAPSGKYTVTVSSAGTGASGGGDYEVGKAVGISAGTPPSGQQFKNWTSADEGIIFANANSAATSFVMPANAVTVTAVFGAEGFTDARDGKFYKTVTIGGAKWMAENMNYQTASDSWCYGGSADSCAKYGRLYTLAAALDVCPSGWHLSSTQEWTELAVFAGGTGELGSEGTAGTKLKAKSGWSDIGINGTDAYGFSALPGGQYIRSSADFKDIGDNGYWWTNPESSQDWSNVRIMGYDSKGTGEAVRAVYTLQAVGQSVRCVEDTLFKVTVLGANATGSGSYAAGATVSINAGSAPAGMQFENWTTASGGVLFTDANSIATTFVMPTNAVTVTANFIKVPWLADARDGKLYRTVEIGGKTWMAENLNYQPSGGSWCYNESADNCTKYGRLYDWSTAKTVCPTGWHLPSRAEWNNLVAEAGGYSTAGKKFKAKNGWNNNGNGTDDYGFSALPGGDRGADGGFYGAAGNGYWWTDTESGGSNAYGRDMRYNYDIVYEDNIDKGYAFSVRCISD